jgi:hypothetical protein
LESQAVFGDNQRYYAAQPNARRTGESLAQQAAARTLERLLSAHEQEWRETVKRTFRQWNNILRTYLRDETALRLSVGEAQQSVPVRVTDAIPEPFAEIVSEFNDPLIWKLYLSRAVLAASVQGIRLAETEAPAIGRNEKLQAHPAAPEELRRVREHLEALNNYLNELELIERIKGLNSDVLGAYFFRVPEVQLYWKVIGLMAGILNVSVEALTVVVLAHELAHAYTHLGKDIDGNLWDTKSFADADLEIVEGLAQFYTAVICAKLAARFPAASQAYESLLNMQSGAYVVHKGWTDQTERGGEIVRFAMIATRSRKLLRYSQWSAELDNVRPQMGRAKPTQSSSQG